MASVSLIKLTRLLLQRSDRHPVSRLNGNDQKATNPAVFSLFLHLGLVVEEPPLSEADGVMFETAGNRVWGFCEDGTADGDIATEDDLRQFRIDLMALCRQIRKANNMQGPPVEPLGPFTFRIGAIGTGIRRRQYFLARALRVKKVLEVAYAIRGQADAGSVVILTPTQRNLPASTIKLLAAENIEFVSIDDHIDEGVADPFALRLLSTTSAGAESTASPLLFIDTGGHRAHFHGVEVGLTPRAFNIFVLLANEAADEAGIVSRDRLLDCMRGADGHEEVASEQLDKVISHLRGALTSAAGMSRSDGRKLITSRRGIGYRLDLSSGDIGIY